MPEKRRLRPDEMTDWRMDGDGRPVFDNTGCLIPPDEPVPELGPPPKGDTMRIPVRDRWRKAKETR